MLRGAATAKSRRISSQAVTMSSAVLFGSSPSSALASAQHFLRSTCASICACGTGRNDTGKLSTARCVVAPYSASLGTSISPIESVSRRVLLAGACLDAGFDAGFVLGVLFTVLGWVAIVRSLLSFVSVDQDGKMRMR